MIFNITKIYQFKTFSSHQIVRTIVPKIKQSVFEFCFKQYKHIFSGCFVLYTILKLIQAQLWSKYVIGFSIYHTIFFRTVFLKLRFFPKLHQKVQDIGKKYTWIKYYPYWISIRSYIIKLFAGTPSALA